MTTGRLLLFLALTLAAALTIRVLLNREDTRLVEITRRNAVLGTFSTFMIIAHEDSANMILDSMDSLTALLDRDLGVFQPLGELSRLNAAGGASFDTISSHLAHVLRLSLLAAEVTDSLFDPSMGPLVALWDFGGDPVLPDSASIRTALLYCGLERVSFTEAGVELASGTWLDLGAVAKGYTADAVFDLADSLGARSVLVEIGGEIRCGDPGGTGRVWRIGISDPRGEGITDALEMTSGSVATSGDYESFFIHNTGERYCHILDPRTGYPETGMASVTVVAATAGMADALATAVAVGGVDLADSIPDSLFRSITVVTELPDGSLEEWRRDGRTS